MDRLFRAELFTESVSGNRCRYGSAILWDPYQARFYSSDTSCSSSRRTNIWWSLRSLCYFPRGMTVGGGVCSFVPLERRSTSRIGTEVTGAAQCVTAHCAQCEPHLNKLWIQWHFRMMQKTVTNSRPSCCTWLKIGIHVQLSVAFLLLNK